MSSSYSPTAEFTDTTTVLADGDAANATNINAAPKKALDRAAYLRDATDGLLVWGGNARRVVARHGDALVRPAVSQGGRCPAGRQPARGPDATAQGCRTARTGRGGDVFPVALAKGEPTDAVQDGVVAEVFLRFAEQHGGQIQAVRRSRRRKFFANNLRQSGVAIH